MISIRAFSLVVGFLAWACVGGTALAQPSATEKETARGLVHTGNERFAAGDFAAALEAYQKADDLMHAPTTAFGVGRSLAQLGRLAEARDALLRAERSPAQPGESDAFAAARADAAALAAELLPRLATLRLAGRCNGKDGAVVVTVDGARLPALDGTMPLRVDPGMHHLIAESPSCTREERDVSVATAEALDVAFELKPVATASATPRQAAPAPPPATAPVPWALPLVIGGSSLAGAAAIVGVATGVGSLNIAADLERSCPTKECPAARSDDIALGNALANASTASFVVSGAGAALAIVGVVGFVTVTDDGDKRALSLGFGPGTVWIGGTL